MGTATTTTELVEPPDLAQATRRMSERARDSGALIPLDTKVRRLVANDIPFLVRVSNEIQRKGPASEPHQTTGDPFTPPYEADLFVGHLSPTHAALLNKFNVLDDHLLLVTRDWEEQAAMLTRADYEALLLGLAGVDGLAFYNGGAEAGASQPHKHLQLVPLPLADDAAGLPLDNVFEDATWHQGIGRAETLPFEHRIMPFERRWLEAPQTHAVSLQDAVETLWRELGFNPRAERQPVPYNLLATRRWLWLVPRTVAGWRGLPVNALGYAGALIAQDEACYQRLQQLGPLNLLTDCAVASGPWSDQRL
jgi:ATP adenylyltransferase